MMHKITKTHHYLIAAVILGCICGIGLGASAAGDVQRGGLIAHEQCANCHIVGKNETNALETQPAGPDFMTVRALNAVRLKARLNGHHPVMSKFPHLNNQQIEDLAAYMASVRK